MLTQVESMSMQSGVQTLNKGFYDVAGPLDGRPIVLVHGSTVTRKSWLLQVEALRYSYRIVIPDLPGHGALSHQAFDFDTALHSLYDLVQQEARGPVLMAGISLGGHVATLFAHRYPELVDGLVISGASGQMQGAVGMWMRLIGAVLLRFFREDRLRANLEKSLQTKWPADVAQAQVADGVFPRGGAQSFLQIPRYDYRRLIATVCAPVLVLNGEYDRANRKGEAAFAAATPNGRVEVVTGAGHACNVENAVEYNRRLLQFTNEVALGMGR
jgi:pimeloyl-ACP methyl ester carboxylesterase